jgi:hypothetical protein
MIMDLASEGELVVGTGRSRRRRGRRRGSLASRGTKEVACSLDRPDRRGWGAVEKTMW